MSEVSRDSRPPARQFRSIDYIKITVFGFALSALWSSLHMVIMPLRLLDFVPQAQKNTYLDLLILSGLVLGMTIQPIAGTMSDRSDFRWGRRRPYILLGSILMLLFLPGIGFAGSYAVIFVFYCLLQVSSNLAQGAYQGFIPDLVPEGKRGVASGVRGLFYIVGGVGLVRLIAPLMDRYFTGEGSPWLWLALTAPAVVLLGTMLATVLTVKERPGRGMAQLPRLAHLYQSFKIDFRARPDFLLFLVGSFLSYTAWGTLMGHALYYLMDVVGITEPAEAISTLVMAVGIGMLVTVYPAGRLADRIGRRQVAMASGLLGALGTTALFYSQSYLPIMLSGGLLGISNGAWTSSQWALATELVGEGEEAKHLGLVNMSIAGAGAVSRLIGPVIDHFNTYRPNLGYRVMLLFTFTCLLAGSLFILRIKRRWLAKVA